jgi:hypothetical protein
MTTLQTFVVEALRAFQFLRRDYLFDPPEQRGEGYWRGLRYRTSATEVVINYEIGTLPVASIGRLEHRASRLLAAEVVDVDFLLDHAGEKPLIAHWLPGDVPDDVLSGHLAYLAEGLKRHGAPFLRGEFGTSWQMLASTQRSVYERRLTRTIESEETRHRR